MTWVEHIARAMRDGDEAALDSAHVELCRLYGTGQARDMFSIAAAEAAAAADRRELVQGALW